MDDPLFPNTARASRDDPFSLALLRDNMNRTTHVIRSAHIAAVLVTILLPVSSLATIDSFAVIETLNGELSGDQFGFSVSSAGDFNNDGWSDIVIGANANDDGGSAAGKCYIYLGGALFSAAPAWSAIGTAGDFLGGDVAGIGDVDADGFDDVLAGAPFANDLGPQAGKAHLYLGGNPLDTAVDLILHGESSLDQFGSTVAGLGDINGDGYDDWAIGAFRADSGSLSDIGKVYIYFGSSTPDTVANITILGKASGERFGFAIAGLGRFNGDAYDDFAVGAYSYDGPSLTNVGRVYIFHGGNPPDTVPDLILTGQNAHDFFGFHVGGIGDANGDGFDDLAVGAPGFNVGSFADAGKMYVYHGGVVPDAVIDFEYAPAQNNNDQFGAALSGAGDLDNDGRDDFLVGAPLDKVSGADAGRAYVFRGNNPPPHLLDFSLGGPAAGAQLGYAVAGLGQIADNVISAFAVGAPGGASSTGVIIVYASIDTTSSPQDCVCSCHADPNCDGIRSDVLDVVQTINIAFRGAVAIFDGDCPAQRTDFDCNGVSDVLDVVGVINVAFRGADALTAFCNPCDCLDYPSECP